MKGEIPHILAIQSDQLTWERDARPMVSRHLDPVGGLQLMAILDGAIAVLEDVSPAGELVYVGLEGVFLRLPTSLETTADVPDCARYGGHDLEEVLPGRPDLLRSELLRDGEDPDPDLVRRLFPPIRHVRFGDREGPNAFVGTPECLDVMPLYYDPRDASPRVHPLIVAPEIGRAIDAGIVDQGLVGGWLPVVRTSWPLKDHRRWEQVTFADMSSQAIGPLRVWYRFMFVEDGVARHVRYVDSYLPYPNSTDPSASAFYAALLDTARRWEQRFHGVAGADLPDESLVDRARHSIALELITRFGDEPRYGVVDRAYGAPEHDGFQDILNTSVACMLEWGLFDPARRHLENYLTRFVRPDGSVNYRGPEIGQYARMLTIVAQYAAYTGDDHLLVRYLGKLEAIVEMLLLRREHALELPADDPGHGLIHGRHEADISFDSGTLGVYNYERPYFSNSAQAWRGLRDLGRELHRIGGSLGRADITQLADRALMAADGLRADLLRAIDASWRPARGEEGLPLFPGAELLHFEAPYRSRPEAFDENRVWAELLGSGVLDRRTTEKLLEYAASVGGSTLGVFGNRRLIVSFMADETASGLIQHDQVPALLLLFWTHVYHLRTRGTWMALECVDLDRERAGHLPYCVPAQLAVPLILRWMLVFEDPANGDLWLLRAIPRAWLGAGRRLAVGGMPTRWGRLSVDLVATEDLVELSIEPPPNLRTELVLRLRLPTGTVIDAIEGDSENPMVWNAATESVGLGQPRSAIRVWARVRRQRA